LYNIGKKGKYKDYHIVTGNFEDDTTTANDVGILDEVN
jgi:hypothetical protein